MIVLLAVLALIAAACGGGDDGGDGGDSAGGEGGGDGEVSGEATMLHALTNEEDVAGLEAMIAGFEEANPGATIAAEGSPSFEEQALTRIEGGSPPDMILHPQPGLMKDFYDRGAAQAWDIDLSTIEEEYVEGTLQSGVVNGEQVGIPIRLSTKSLVWYSPRAFEEGGYEIPANWQEMLDLTEQIKSDGTAPWCIGIESSTATGWVLTDWVEDVMLRLHGPDVYDEWVGHAVEFNSPEVTEAYERVGEIWFAEGNVLGGRPNILQTGFFDAPLPMFEDPPACVLHRQASFVVQGFPEDAEFGTDYDFFQLPPIEDGGTGDNPMLTAGDLLTPYSDNPVSAAFMEYAATAEAQELWAPEGSYLCPNSTCDPSAYPNESFVQQGELLAEASSARFDASDLMPAQVGAGSFWSESVAWIADNQDLETTLSNIDATWPEGACGVGGVGPNCEGDSEVEAGAASEEAESGASEAGS